jgi:hypothetical protein
MLFRPLKIFRNGLYKITSIALSVRTIIEGGNC